MAFISLTPFRFYETTYEIDSQKHHLVHLVKNQERDELSLSLVKLQSVTKVPHQKSTCHVKPIDLVFFSFSFKIHICWHTKLRGHPRRPLFMSTRPVWNISHWHTDQHLFVHACLPVAKVSFEFSKEKRSSKKGSELSELLTWRSSKKTID